MSTRKFKLGTRNETIEKTYKFLSILYTQCKDKFVPQSEAFSIKVWNDDSVSYQNIPLSEYCNRDASLNKEYLIRYGLLEKKKINEIVHVRWIGKKPNNELVSRICDDINVKKNFKNNNTETIIEEKIVPVVKDNIHTVEFSTDDDVDIKSIKELIAAQRVESNKALEYAKALNQEVQNLNSTIKLLVDALSKK